jgi:hypothetical protein
MFYKYNSKLVPVKNVPNYIAIYTGSGTRSLVFRPKHACIIYHHDDDVKRVTVHKGCTHGRLRSRMTTIRSLNLCGVFNYKFPLRNGWETARPKSL